jgi:very-short-patch-repair endonuclease/DNA polymerase III delta prime subunit
MRRVDDWKSRLIDLTRRNNLLYFHASKRGNLSINEPDAETIFKELVIKKKRLEFWLPPEETENQNDVSFDDLSVPMSKKPGSNQLANKNLERDDLERTLKNLQRRSLLDYRERGVRILYAAFGRLNWVDSETKENVHSPLILVPLELVKETVRKPFEAFVPPVEEEAIVNPALQVKLKSEFKIDLPPAPEDWETETLASYFDAVAQTVSELGWTVESAVDLGLFSFHKLVIYKDLESNVELVTQHPIIRAIVGIKDENLILNQLPDEKDVDKIQLPEKTYQVLDADSSQRVSVEYALRGQSFVMQGPPGTGKSQTIANIIAECIAHGKSVLFVSDKMAALDVVYNRLEAVGLKHFCLELHSSKANKQEVVAELKRSLDEHLVPRKLPSAHEFETMKTYRDSLNGYVTALHEKRPFMQTSAYNALSIIASLERVAYVTVGLTDLSTLTPQKISELEGLTSELSKVWQVVEEPDFPWAGYRASLYNLDVRSELLTSIEVFNHTVEDLQLEGASYCSQLGLSSPVSLDRVKWLTNIGKLLFESPKPEAQWLLRKDVDTLITEAKGYNETCQWIKNTRKSLLERYNGSLFNLAFDRSNELKKNLLILEKLFPGANLHESTFLDKQEKLLTYIRSTQSAVRKWFENAKALADLFGVSIDTLNLQNVMYLSKLALFCFTEDKPESQWFDSLVFQQVSSTISKTKDTYQQHNLLKERLSRSYTAGIYDLDLDELVIRYNNSYQGLTKLFSSSFRNDQKQIARVSIDGKVSKTVLEDLIDARKVKTLSAEIDAQAENVRQLLGRFYQGYDTDFLRIEKALNMIKELKTVPWANPLSENLVKLLTHSSSPSPMIKHLGSELEDSIAKWEQQAKDVSELIPENLPYSNAALNQTALQRLEEWVLDVEKQLAPLNILTKETLSTTMSSPKTYKQLLEDLTNAEEVRKKEATVTGEKSQLQIKYGSRFNELETNWTDIIYVLEWVKRAQTVFGDVVVPEAFALLAANGSSNAPSDAKLNRYYETALQSLAVFEARFESELKYQNQKLRDLPLQIICERLKILRERVDELQIWIDFKDLRNRFALRGIGGFFERLVEQKTPSNQLIDSFRRGAYQEWINNLYNEDSRLGRFRRENHEQLINDFNSLDKKLIHLTSSMVIEAANSRKPQDILIQASDSEAAILMREAAKKRRIMPIRNLLQKIPHLLVKLKPCLLMSPISVSQFLAPETAHFDLVLFDEASQIVPEDAIGSIYRGKTLVVAGDNKQLPPTSFFQTSLIDNLDWSQVNDEDFEVFDSIIDECLGIGLPVKTLRWHYRSKHEDLIAFSNHKFYDDNLVTFPAAKAQHDSLGVKMVYVPNGLYDRGGARNNQVEAETVVNLVFDHFTKYPKKTLGVVTFSVAQMETIAEAIDQRLKEQPEFEKFFIEDRLEGFFVKNLENVQGDERDVIFFSVGYGRDQNGQMTMNFGPLNKPGGERRLNVAVTRAREKVVIVTSIKSVDIDSETKAEGVQTLRSYLDYAEKGPDSLATPYKRTGTYESALDEDIALEIQKLGYEVMPQVGCSGYKIDIGVLDPVNPGCYLLGVECDGTTYRSSNSARDRDRLREQVLKGLGWRIHRVWAPSWVARRDSEVKRLKEALEQAQKLRLDQESLQPSVTLKEDGIVETEVRKVKFAGIEKIGTPYKIYPLKAAFNPYIKIQTEKSTHTSNQKNEFHYPENRDIQTHLLGELVEKEGPIHFDYAVERLADAWGIKRITPKISHAAQEALNTLIRDQKITIKGSFLWPPHLKDVQIRIPVDGIAETKRNLEYLPPEEVEAVMKLVAQYALGISDESLIAETAKVFGFNHSTDKSKEYFNEILKRLIQERKIAQKDGVITLT